MGRHEGHDAPKDRTRWYRGVHSDDALDDLGPEPIPPAEDDEPESEDDLWAFEGHRADRPKVARARLIGSGLGILVFAVIIAWSGVTIFSAHGQDITPAGAPTTTTASRSASPVPVIVLPTGSASVGRATSASPTATAGQNALSTPQPQDLSQPTPAPQPPSDHVRASYPPLARRYLTPPDNDDSTTPSPTPSRTPPPSPATSPSQPSPSPVATSATPTPTSTARLCAKLAGTPWYPKLCHHVH